MHTLYQKNFIFIRPAQSEDALALSSCLRQADRAELKACFADQEPASLLAGWMQYSVGAHALFYKGKIGALFGLSPNQFFSSQVCVWLLTTPEVERIPKTFLRLARAYVAWGLTKYALLYNFVDERYTQAQRLITHLGGKFPGEKITRQEISFFYFTFRRKQQWEEL